MASIGIGALGEPAIAHLLEPRARRRARSRGRGRDLGDHRLPADHDRADDRRRDGPEAVRDPARRGRGAADRAAAAVLPDAVQPVHLPAQRVLEPDAADARDRPRRRARRRDAGRAQADHRRVADRRSPRRRRGEHAHRRLPPPRAGGPSGDDADSGGRHRRPCGERSRWRCAAASRPATRGSS